MKVDINKNVERHQRSFTRFNNKLFLFQYNQPADGFDQSSNVAHIKKNNLKNQSNTLIKT
jgi:hypothetical protein